MRADTFNKMALPACASSLTLLAAMMVSQGAVAHGNMTNPPSRAMVCNQGMNKDCGGAEYEPQSVGETFKGFPAGVGGGPMQGPIDGKIPSGNNPSFSALDAQSATRWYLTEIKQRNIDFTWKYTAVHPATKHEYFITKSGWNPNEPLTRASFDSAPFCFIDGGGSIPLDGAPHSCVIPDDRIGHHVILGIWTVDDTANAFHNVVDVNILAESSLPDGWTPAGAITPTQALIAGDKVNARAFTDKGENAEYSAKIDITDAQAGKPENWSFALAEQINNTQTLIRAGVRDTKGNIEPIKGVNPLYAKKESGVIRYEITLEMLEDTEAKMQLGNMAPEHELVKGLSVVAVPVLSNRAMAVEATVYDKGNKQVGKLRQDIEAGDNALLNVDVRSEPGTHSVKLVGTTADNRTTRQDLKQIELTGEGGAQDYEFEFPNNISSYTAGTKVLQPKNGNVYECKPFPYSGYCTQYSPTANGFEPGVGSDWTMAWDQK